MAKAVFIYNELQGTQRQVQSVAKLIAYETATWPVSQDATTCTIETDKGQLVATGVTPTHFAAVTPAGTTNHGQAQRVRQALELFSG